MRNERGEAETNGANAFLSVLKAGIPTGFPPRPGAPQGRQENPSKGGSGGELQFPVHIQRSQGLSCNKHPGEMTQ